MLGNYKALTLMVLLAGLLGCSENVAQNATVEIDAKSSLEERSEIVDEAKSFITSHMKSNTTESRSKLDDGSDTITYSSNEPYDVKLGHKWSWGVRSSNLSRSGDLDISSQSDIKYAFLPSEISLPVKSNNVGGFHQVQLECLKGSCISADGWMSTKMEPALVPAKGRQQSSDSIGNVFITFDSAEEAERSAKAFNVLLREAGAKERHF